MVFSRIIVSLLIIYSQLVHAQVEKPCYENHLTDIGEDIIFKKPETDPDFKTGYYGLQRFVSKNAKFDSLLTSVKNDTHLIWRDTIIMKFVVKKHGGLSDMSVVAGNNSSAKQEAMRLLKLSCSYWIPSNISGRSIYAWFLKVFIFEIKNSGHRELSIKVIDATEAERSRFIYQSPDIISPSQ